MPGRTISDGYRCTPLTSSRRFGRGVGTPITFQSLTGSQLAAAGHRVVECFRRVYIGKQLDVRFLATARRVNDLSIARFDFARVRHSRFWHAISTNTCRAVAAAWRMAGTVCGVEPLPAVPPSSGTSSVSAITSVTRSTGTRSSSAAASVNSVRDALAAFHFAGEQRHLAVFADVQSSSQASPGRSRRTRRGRRLPPRRPPGACWASADCGKSHTAIINPAPSTCTNVRRLTPK